MKKEVKLVNSLASTNALLPENKERVLARQLARKLNKNELREVSGGACRRTNIPMLDIQCDVPSPF